MRCSSAIGIEVGGQAVEVCDVVFLAPVGAFFEGQQILQFHCRRYVRHAAKQPATLAFQRVDFVHPLKLF